MKAHVTRYLVSLEVAWTSNLRWLAGYEKRWSTTTVTVVRRKGLPEGGTRTGGVLLKRLRWG